MQKLISLSIVTYKTSPEELNRVYRSIDLIDANWKLFIVDNSETNELGQLFVNDSRVKYIFNNSNLGFGRAHNIAIEKAILEGIKYHFIVNPDIYFLKDIACPMIRMIEKDDSIGMIMPKVLNDDGSIQFLPKLLPTPASLILRKLKKPRFYYDKFIRRYELRNVNENLTYNTPILSGCFTLLNLQAIKAIGSFDDSYFMYFEDWDLSRRMHKHYKTLYFPDVEVFHGYESGANKSPKLFKIFLTSAIYYFNKWGWFFDPERKVMNENTTMQFKDL